ncbi:MAG: hypothetical protein IJM59_12740 [Proteobacteria bacterium]|nr:hypothetical protein [Pseudomonadota bacterium]
MKLSKTICAYLLMTVLLGCSSDDSSEKAACDDNAKPSEDCVCRDNEWDCPDNTIKCPAKCPEHCGKDGVCLPDDSVECPADCPEHCGKDGVCLPDDSVECPADCPEHCDEKGVCLPNEEAGCPDECPDHCDEAGTCLPEEKVECPAECPDDCDASGNCSSECPAECSDTCIDGVCPEEKPVACPEACPDTCDSEGICPVSCPEKCGGKCNDDGSCQNDCPEDCPDNCIDASTCPPKCPQACPDTCNDEGMCPCLESCKTSCDNEGKCLCPETCKTSCNDDGVCQCPDACKDSCNKNGECPVMCGSETVESMYFLFPENDLLIPGYKARQAVTIPIYIKTNKKTYKNTEAPCEIVLKSSDTKIMKVAMKDNVPTFSPVAAGRTTGTATIKGQSMSATVKINVLNPDNLKENVAKKNSKDNLIHVYKGPFKLNRSGRVCQGFDFNTSVAPTDSDFVYFTQLSEDPISVEGKPYRTRIVVFPDKLSDLKGAKKAMSLFHFGHGQGVSVEHTDKQDYIWVGSYGTLKSKTDQSIIDKGFGSQQTLVRIPFEPEKSYYPEDKTLEHYYLPPLKSGYFHKLEPALDVKNNRFVLRAKNSGDKKTYIKIYGFKDVSNLKLSSKEVTLAHPILTFNKDGKVVEKKISTKVKDFSNLTPIHEFAVEGFPVQGVAMDNGLIYAVTNNSKELSTTVSKKPGDYTHNFQITVKLYSQGGTELASYNLQNSKANGGYLINSEMDAIVNEYDESGKPAYWNVGYFEPEGIRVRDGKVYISISGKRDYYDDKGKVARTGAQYIFVYDLAK